jgi:hypothetical protein
MIKGRTTPGIKLILNGQIGLAAVKKKSTYSLFSKNNVRPLSFQLLNYPATQLTIVSRNM